MKVAGQWSLLAWKKEKKKNNNPEAQRNFS